jgi:hypothetical protein
MAEFSDWLKDYYSRVQSEYEFSFSKKDNLTNWSLTILIATLGLYFGNFVGIGSFDSESRFAIVIGTLIIVIQFFVNSMLTYGFMKKWRFIKEEIEKHWMTGKPTLDEIKNYVVMYDHGRRLRSGWKEMLWAQLRAGFLLILAMPISLGILEIYSADHISRSLSRIVSSWNLHRVAAFYCKDL